MSTRTFREEAGGRPLIYFSALTPQPLTVVWDPTHAGQACCPEPLYLRGALARMAWQMDFFPLPHVSEQMERFSREFGGNDTDVNMLRGIDRLVCPNYAIDGWLRNSASGLEHKVWTLKQFYEEWCLHPGAMQVAGGPPVIKVPSRPRRTPRGVRAIDL